MLLRAKPIDYVLNLCGQDYLHDAEMKHVSILNSIGSSIPIYYKSYDSTSMVCSLPFDINKEYPIYSDLVRYEHLTYRKYDFISNDRFEFKPEPDLSLIITKSSLNETMHPYVFLIRPILMAKRPLVIKTNGEYYLNSLAFDYKQTDLPGIKIYDPNSTSPSEIPDVQVLIQNAPLQPMSSELSVGDLIKENLDYSKIKAVVRMRIIREFRGFITESWNKWVDDVHNALLISSKLSKYKIRKSKEYFV